MPQRILRFKIRQDGIVEESVEGVVSQDCYELTERIENSLGEIQKRQPTADAFLTDQSQVQSVSSEQLL